MSTFSAQAPAHAEIAAGSVATPADELPTPLSDPFTWEHQSVSTAIQAWNRKYPEVASTLRVDSKVQTITAGYLATAPLQQIEIWRSGIDAISKTSPFPVKVEPLTFVTATREEVAAALGLHPEKWVDTLGGSALQVGDDPKREGGLLVYLSEGAPREFSLEIQGVPVRVAAGKIGGLPQSRVADVHIGWPCRE